MIRCNKKEIIVIVQLRQTLWRLTGDSPATAQRPIGDLLESIQTPTRDSQETARRPTEDMPETNRRLFGDRLKTAHKRLPGKLGRSPIIIRKQPQDSPETFQRMLGDLRVFSGGLQRLPEEAPEQSSVSLVGSPVSLRWVLGFTLSILYYVSGAFCAYYGHTV